MLKKYESLIVALFATIVRYHDYALFGLFASLLAKNFMPFSENSNQILSFFAIFSISTFSRPLGSIIFGQIGDQFGRTISIKISAFLAALSTLLIGITPSFNSIGYIAVILVIILRMLFLVSLAGEVDALKIYIIEKIDKKHTYIAAGIASFSSQIGVLIASLGYYLAVYFHEQAPWLWRVNFIIGGICGFCVIMLRNKLQESAYFLAKKASESKNIQTGITDIILDNKDKFFIAIIVSGMLGGIYHFLIIFFSSFCGNVVGLISAKQASMFNIILVCTYAFSCLAAGYILDQMKAKMIINIAIILSMLCALTIAVAMGSDILFVTAYWITVFLVPFYHLPCIIKIQSLFPAVIRMRMYSLSHSLGSMIFSTTTPVICMLIWKITASASCVAIYLLFQLGVLFYAILYIFKKNYDNMLSG